MDTWINAVKAPFTDVSTLPETSRPNDKQIALVWALIGVIVARSL